MNTGYSCRSILHHPVLIVKTDKKQSVLMTQIYTSLRSREQSSRENKKRRFGIQNQKKQMSCFLSEKYFSYPNSHVINSAINLA
jgi:hypothetical protein